MEGSEAVRRPKGKRENRVFLNTKTAKATLVQVLPAERESEIAFS